MKHRIPVARSVPLNDNSISELEELGEGLGYPLMLKSRTEPYDGRDNFAIKDASVTSGHEHAPRPASLR